MSRDTETDVTEVLSDEQRLTLLEKRATRDRFMLWGVSGVLLLVLLVWLTTGLMRLFSNDEALTPSSPEIQALQKQAAGFEEQLARIELQLAQQNTRIVTLSAAQSSVSASPSAPVASGERSDTLQQVARLMISQEQTFQGSLTALKTGMRDLAAMIPGSRSWLEYYNESLDKPLAESQARVKQLQQWSTGKPVQRPTAP